MNADNWQRHVGRIAKNSAFLFASNIVSKGLSFLYVMYMAQYLGSKGFGVISTAVAFSNLFSILSDLGLSTLTVREVARERNLASKYLGNALAIKLSLSFLTYILIISSVKYMNYSQETIKVVYLVAISIIMDSFARIFNAIFQAHERMEYTSIAQVLQSAAFLVGVFAVIYIKGTVLHVAYVYIFAALVKLLFCLHFCISKFSKPVLYANKDFVKFMIKEALPFGLTGLFVSLYYYTDSVMLSYFKGVKEVGFYNAAYKIAMVFNIIPQIYFTAIFPNMSRWFKENLRALYVSFEVSLKLMLYIGILIGVVISLLSTKIILLVFGEEFLASANILVIIIWSISLSFVNISLAIMLDVSNNQRFNTIRMAIGILFNVFLNFLLIPSYGALGAAIATLLTRLFVMGLLVVFLRWKRVVIKFPKIYPTREEIEVVTGLLKTLKR